MSQDIVYFLMPDGTKVTNDPRVSSMEQLEEMLAAIPNSGDVGVHEAEQKAQSQLGGAATLNSGQPGVGENAVPDDITGYLPDRLGTAAMQRQATPEAELDVKKAEAAGGSLESTTVEDPEPVDSNAAVLEIQEEKEEVRKAALKAAEALTDEPDPDTPMDDWTGAQLKAEALKRNAAYVNAEEEPIDLTGVKKKAQLVELLKGDDTRWRDFAGDGPTGD